MACLLGQHGQIALGKTLDKALWMAAEVETIARLYVQALVIGEPPVLPDGGDGAGHRPDAAHELRHGPRA
jgi:ribulose-5-phosphate 4-epimerase/fuculose-1-phosphate aldolase